MSIDAFQADDGERVLFLELKIALVIGRFSIQVSEVLEEDDLQQVREDEGVVGEPVQRLVEEGLVVGHGALDI